MLRIYHIVHVSFFISSDVEVIAVEMVFRYVYIYLEIKDLSDRHILSTTHHWECENVYVTMMCRFHQDINNIITEYAQW